MKEIIKITDWKKANNITMEKTKDGKKLEIINPNNDKYSINLNRKIKIKDKKINQLSIEFYGDVENSGAYLEINGEHNIPINSKNIMKLTPPINLDVKLVISANSKIAISNIEFELLEEKKDLTDELDTKKDVLVIVPNYPSYENLYLCAFAHSRTKEYVKEGLNVQVIAVNSLNWFQTIYEKDNVSVFKGSYKDLKKMLTKHQYKVVVTHFVDEYLYPIFDGNIYENEKLIFICHGPETTHRLLTNKCRPYFTAPDKNAENNPIYDEKDFYIKKYAEKENVEWVFVSQWLKETTEQEHRIKFKNSRVISNFIDEKLFPYKKKDPNMRKKILVIRKFDNIRVHSVDQVVLAIRELSRRECFKDMEFSIYGDGTYYDELLNPLKQFNNVNLYRRFVPNEKIHEIHAEHGILLIPSRHDSQGVSIGEAASSGLAVVGSKVTCLPEFMNEQENHTLADPEDYIQLANIVERLYNNPDEFEKVCENMSKIVKPFGRENTIMKEVQLIKESIKASDKKEKFLPVSKLVDKPILTIGVPSYNVEQYLEKCLISIINARNSNKIEVLVINDGSKDRTAEIASEYEKKTKGIVRLINKENGGHGSTINVAIKEAKGKYFRLIDSDDWVDSENLAKLVDIMENEDSDIILSKGCYDYIEEARLHDIIKYDHLNEGTKYNFEDLSFDNYGFVKYGPLLTTGNYRTDILKETNFTISEKKPYVDMEFNSFSIRDMNTITYYNCDIYRYLIGREGQTVSRDYWKKKYKDHEYIIFNILEKVLSDDKYTHSKIQYIYKNIISQMVDSQIFMFDALCKWDELEEFLKRLKTYKIAYEYSMKYIKNSNGNCWLILNYYRKKLKSNSTESIVIPGIRETMNDVKEIETKSVKKIIKKGIKSITPYGILRLREIYNNRK